MFLQQHEQWSLSQAHAYTKIVRPYQNNCCNQPPSMHVEPDVLVALLDLFSTLKLANLVHMCESQSSSYYQVPHEKLTDGSLICAK